MAEAREDDAPDDPPAEIAPLPAAYVLLDDDDDDDSDNKQADGPSLGVGEDEIARVLHAKPSVPRPLVVTETQPMGGRLAQPALWRQAYLLPFTSYRMLDKVRIVHGIVR